MYIFCFQHICYLIVSSVISAVAVILIKLFCRTKKSIGTAVRASGAILFVFAAINRISCFLLTEFYLLPASLCGNLSLAFSIFLMFGKEDNVGFHFITIPAIVFCLPANIYPTYITQDPSFWFMPTIFGLLHHSMAIYCAILILVTGWYKPGVKHMLAFPMGFCLFIVYGVFNITVLGRSDSMNIIQPIITLGNIELTWFLAGTLTMIGIWIINLSVDAAKYKRECAVCRVYEKIRGKLTASADKERD